MSRTLHHGDKAKERQFGNDWQWLKNEPKYWRKMHKHRPRRREARHIEYKAVTEDLEQVWPLDSKPWIYYW